MSSDWLFCGGESVVYQACLSWGRARCLSREEDATDPAVRAALGPALHAVRLPCLPTAHLGELLGDSHVVTDEEKGTLYTYTVTGKGRGRLGYPTRPRTYTPSKVARFSNMSAQSNSTRNQAKLDVIKVSRCALCQGQYF